MTAWALRASILIALEAREGVWCTTGWIANEILAKPIDVDAECAAMAEAGLVMRSLLPFEPGPMAVYGINVIHDAPLSLDSAWAGLTS
jgi:hypothetical protein